MQKFEYLCTCMGGLLSGRFKMVDIGPLSWVLGINFIIEKDCISMSQSTYLKNALTMFKMQDCTISVLLVIC